VVTAGKGITLKFISGRYMGGDFPLTEGKPVVVGRTGEPDMLLSDDLVSRRHARFLLQGSQLVVEDLGSTNGVFVNGKRVGQASLSLGDRVLIGSSILRVTERQAGAVDDAVSRQRLEALGAAEAAGGAMTGKLEEVPLPDLLQLLQTSKKTGVLTVQGAQLSRVLLRKGRVAYAVIGDRHEVGPAKSLGRMLAWTSGTFELVAGEPPAVPNELAQPTEALLAEAVRLQEEFKRLEPQLPPAKALLLLSLPLEAPLRALSPDELDVLQLALNHRSLGAMLEKTQRPDAEVAVLLMGLIQRGYLRAAV
jgi:hypothetical protein